MASIDAFSSAALYGKGVFTTIAIRGGEPFLWEKHWRRLAENAAKLSIDLAGVSEDSLLDSLKKATDGLPDGRARITLFDESPSAIWPSKAGAKTNFQIITGQRQAIPDQFRLTVSPHLINSTSPLAGIKSCNYLGPVMSIEETRSRGCAEAVRLNERAKVTSACMANIFWSNQQRLFTPSLDTGCLSGTTREYVLENLECDEVEAGIKALLAAEQIFLTSAALGVVAVDEFDGRELGAQTHPILDLLRH